MLIWFWKKITFKTFTALVLIMNNLETQLVQNSSLLEPQEILPEEQLFEEMESYEQIARDVVDYYNRHPSQVYTFPHTLASQSTLISL
jgi:hypothetical protein